MPCALHDTTDLVDTRGMAERTSINIQKGADNTASRESLLGSQKLVAFVATCNPGRAKEFYRDRLGLKLLSEDPFALVFDAAGTMLRISTVQELAPAKYTVLGWEASDIVHTAQQLQEAHVNLERYPGMQQDELGIWKSPSGARVAWFKDPDGNTLSVTQF